MLTIFKIWMVFNIALPAIPDTVITGYLGPGAYEYCPSRTMNIYGHSRTAIIFVHGGGWRAGSQSVGLAYMGLVDAGYTLVTIELSLGSAPAQMADVFCAIDFLLDNGYDRIGLIGKSSGGHIAALAAMLYKVDAAVIISAPLDLTISCKESVAQAYFGASCGSPDLLKYSPVHRVPSLPTPTLLIHGTGDKVVYPKHSKVFHDKLVEVGAERWSGFLLVSGGHEGLFVNEVIDYFSRAF